MADAEREQQVITRFTSKEWTNDLSWSVGFFLGQFIILSVLGFILCLILMIFIPGLRSAGAVLLSTGIFAAALTTWVGRSTLSRNRAFLAKLTGRVNDAIIDLTDSHSNHLSVEQFRQLILTGNSHPLSVNGVPGLDLVVIKKRVAVEVPGAKPLASAQKDGGRPSTTASTEWRVVVNVTVPEYGISSFDRLLSATTETAG